MLTKEEILNIPAGILMDGLIAGKVFKFGDIQEFDSELSGRTFSGWIDDKNKSILRPEFWSPSENLEDAWKLVEDYNLTIAPYRSVSGIVEKYHASNGEVIAYAETAPLAICRAALLMVITNV